MSGPLQRLSENVVEVTSTVVTGVWLAALFLHQDWWLAAMLVGYVVVVPVTKILAGETDDEEDWDARAGRDHESTGTVERNRDASDSTDDALEELRQRYARGELTEDQFERKLERLLEVETVEDAEEYASRGESGTGERETERQRTRETE